MKYDRLEQARKELDALRREHHSTVTKATAEVKASKKKLEAAERRVRDIEFALVEYEIDLKRGNLDGD